MPVCDTQHARETNGPRRSRAIARKRTTQLHTATSCALKCLTSRGTTSRSYCESSVYPLRETFSDECYLRGDSFGRRLALNGRQRHSRDGPSGDKLVCGSGSDFPWTRRASSSDAATSIASTTLPTARTKPMRSARRCVKTAGARSPRDRCQTADGPQSALQCFDGTTSCLRAQRAQARGRHRVDIILR